MKRIVGFLVVLIMTAAWATPAVAQNKVDNERMDRDIEIAENALMTMIRLQFQKNRYYGMDIKANYTPGYGVTMRIPGENNYVGAIGVADDGGIAYIAAPAHPSSDGGGVRVIRQGEAEVVIADNQRAKEKQEARAGGRNDKQQYKEVDVDSAKKVYYARIIKASKDFLADYGDVLSQLAPEEKIMITNRGDSYRDMYWNRNSGSRTMVTVEATKGDITSFKQGKLTRDQMMAKIRVVNTESTNEVDTDLELLSSIMNRLYRSDLAKTYYVDEGIYYERMKEFGVIYYMAVVSSVEQDVTPGTGRRHRMPTQKLQDLDQAQRDKKVTELYPAFEKDVKENIIEYARTLKSLGPEEMVVFNVRLTKCEQCGIPSSIELSVKNSVLREYSEGKITKDAATARMNVKKGPAQ